MIIATLCNDERYTSARTHDVPIKHDVVRFNISDITLNAKFYTWTLLQYYDRNIKMKGKILIYKKDYAH